MDKDDRVSALLAEYRRLGVVSHEDVAASAAREAVAGPPRKVGIGWAVRVLRALPDGAGPLAARAALEAALADGGRADA
jgi:hypothetical protein